MLDSAMALPTGLILPTGMDLPANLTRISLGDIAAEDPLSSMSVLMPIVSLILRALLVVVVLPWPLAAVATVVTWVTRSIPMLLDSKARPKELPTSVWTIHGKKYDLSSWAKDHPGGEFAINLARNRDGTGLFESYHVFSDRDKLMKILARFEIGAKDSSNASKQAPGSPGSADNNTGLFFNDAFHEDVKALLKEHFAGGRSYKMKPWMQCFVLSLVAFEVYLAYWYLQGSNMALVLLPMVQWLLTCNLAHDGSHFAVSSLPWVNYLASCSAMPMVLPSTCWHIQHVVQHHVYTNDEDDVDLYHFLPVVRTTRLTKWVSQFKLQWLTVLLVLPTSVGHLLFVVPMDLLTGQLDAITGAKRYEQCENIEDMVARSRKNIILEFAFCFGWLVLSLYSLGLSEGMWRSAVSYGIASYLFIINTQGAHLQSECMLDKEGEHPSWAKRQAGTSVNFKPDSHLWLLLSGGLNMQSLHHVAPIVGSSHFMDIYPKYKQLCAKHGIELKETNNIASFFWGFLVWVRELAEQDPADKCKSS